MDYRAIREGALANAELRATQLAEVTRQQFAITFRGMDYALRDLRATYLKGSESFDSASVRALSLLPDIADAGFAIYDARGELVVSSEGWAAPVSIAEQRYFQNQKMDFPLDKAVLGTPERSVQDGEWGISLTRAIVRAGTFQGVMLMRVSPFYFGGELARIGLGAKDTIGIVHLPGGEYLARNWGLEDLLGRAVRPDRPYLLPDAPESGTFMGMATHEPDTRLFAWRRLSELPVVVFVGLAEGNILGPVEAEIAQSRRNNLIVIGLLLVLLAAIVTLLLRNLRQQQDLVEREALYHGLFDQNHSVKLVSDPITGRILAANRAACDFYGYSLDALLALHIWDINCLPREEIRARMAEAQAAKVPYFLFPHRLASGEIRHVEVYSGPIRMEGRTALYSIIHDVTRRYELEEKLRASEARYRTIFETVPAGMMLVNGSEDIVAWNEAASAILGSSGSAIRARSTPVYNRKGQLLTAAERPSRRALVEDITDERIYVLKPDGRRRWMNLHARRVPPTASGEPGGAVISFTDVTRAVELEESLLIFQLVFDATHEGIMVTDTAGVIVKVNRAFEEISGYSAAEAVGQRPVVMSSRRHDKAFYKAMFESLASKGYWEGEITNRHKSGRGFVERAVISAIVEDDGEQVGYVALLSDVTSRKQAEQELWRRANFDALTGLPNRTLLLDRLDQALMQGARRGSCVGVLFIDLDRFKQVNDTYGHAAGDELLKQVADRIRANVRHEDTVARLGGDEFVALLPSVTSEGDALRLAEKIRYALSELFDLEAATVSIGACVGVAIGCGGDASSEELIKDADEAMYQAKEAGRGRVVLASQVGVARSGPS